MKTYKFLISLFILVATFTNTALAQSDSESSKCIALKNEIQEEINNARDCKTIDDCVTFWPGCPFGCGTALNKEQQARIEASVRNYNNECSACAYRCQNLKKTLACINSRCTLETKPIAQ